MGKKTNGKSAVKGIRRKENLSPEELRVALVDQFDYFDEKKERLTKIDVNVVCEMQKTIAHKMKEAHGPVLDEVFMTNFRLLQDLQYNIFASISQTFCGALFSLPKRYDFIEKLLDTWLEYVNHQTVQFKETLFKDCSDIFETLARHISKIGCFSSQLKILKIIYAHTSAPHKHIRTLFGPYIDDEWVFKEMESYETLTNMQKHIAMYRDVPNGFNRKAESKSVFSTVIRYAYVDDKIEELYPSHEGYCDWSLGSKTIEFVVSRDEQEARIEIDITNVLSLQYKTNERKTVLEVTFNLCNSQRMICESKSFPLRAKSIKMVFDARNPDRFESVILNMSPQFGMKSEINKKNNKTVEFSRIFTSTPISSPGPTIDDSIHPFEVLNFKEYQFGSDGDQPRPVVNHSETHTAKGANESQRQEQVTSSQPANKQSSNAAAAAEDSVKKHRHEPVVNNIQKKAAKVKNVKKPKPQVKNGSTTTTRAPRSIRKPSATKPLSLDNEPVVIDLSEPNSDNSIVCLASSTAKPIVVEDYVPKKTHTRKPSIETRSTAAKRSTVVKSETAETPKPIVKRKKATNGITNGNEELFDDTTSKKRPRQQTQSPIFSFDSDEETPFEEPRNIEDDFNSLFAAPSCFKGQVKPNAKDLHKSLANTQKKKKKKMGNSEMTRVSSDDSD